MGTDISYLRYNLHGLLNIAAGILDLCIGLLILLRNPKSKIHRAFFFVTVTAFLWVVNYGIASLVRSTSDASFWMGLSFLFGVPFISPAVYAFSVYWLEPDVKKALIPIGFIGAFLIMIPMVFFTSSF